MSTYRCKSQNSNFELFLKKKKNPIFEFPCCSTREDLSIDVSITNVGLILTKLWRYLFSGCGQTDRRTDRQRHGFGILIFKHVGTQKISTQSSKLVVSRRSLYASRRSGMHNDLEPFESNDEKTFITQRKISKKEGKFEASTGPGYKKYLELF